MEQDIKKDIAFGKSLISVLSSWLFILFVLQSFLNQIKAKITKNLICSTCIYTKTIEFVIYIKFQNLNQLPMKYMCMHMYTKYIFFKVVLLLYINLTGFLEVKLLILLLFSSNMSFLCALIYFVFH